MVTTKHEPRVPDCVDVTRPSIARIYDYLLLGKDNFAADRAAADRLMESRLDPRRLALANRGFLRRTVGFLARQGISQFLDLGSGLPTSPSVHEVAREVTPDARVVYVDHDPIVVAHNDALLATRDGVITIRADVRDPDAVLGHEALTRCLDFGRPVAVLLLSVLHFVSPEEDAPGIIARFREHMAPGSYLAVSIGTSDGADPEMLAEATNTYARARMPFTLRSRAQIMDLFEGFELVEPGLVSLPEWRPEFNTDRTPLRGPTLGATARLVALGSAEATRAFPGSGGENHKPLLSQCPHGVSLPSPSRLASGPGRPSETASMLHRCCMGDIDAPSMSFPGRVPTGRRAAGRG